MILGERDKENCNMEMVEQITSEIKLEKPWKDVVKKAKNMHNIGKILVQVSEEEKKGKD